MIANGHLGHHGEAAQKPADQDKNGLQGKSKPLPQEVGETVRDHHRRQSSVIRAHVLHHHQVSITKVKVKHVDPIMINVRNDVVMQN